MLFVSFVAFVCSSVLAYYEEKEPIAPKEKEVSGSLHIVTNHAEPIHEDVIKAIPTDTPAKPCPKPSLPAHIENGIVFQVTSPQDIVYTRAQSLRKSALLPNQYDILRSINRVITIIILFVTIIIEFHPLLKVLYHFLYNFIK